MTDDSLYIGPPELAPEKLKNMTDKEKVAAWNKAMEDTFGKQEDLHPDLQPWLVHTESFGAALKHPLVFSVPHLEQFNAQMNLSYAQKLRMLDEYREKKNWFGWILAHERPYRLYAFAQIEDDIEDDATYWEVLGHIWTDSENIWQNEEDWIEYMSAERTDRDHLMDEDERAAFAKLPDMIEIHRGYKLTERKLGMSWTTNLPQAEWFARRLIHPDERAYVVSGTVPKDKVLAYFLGRQESEIVVFPEDVTVIGTSRKSAR